MPRAPRPKDSRALRPDRVDGDDDGTHQQADQDDGGDGPSGLAALVALVLLNDGQLLANVTYLRISGEMPGDGAAHRP